MKHISTHTYSIQIDEQFTEIVKKYEYFTLIAQDTKFVMQAPMLIMTLSEIVDLADSEEGSHGAFLYQYFIEKPSNLQLPETMDWQTIAGKEALVQATYSTLQNATDSVVIHQYFITIPLDDAFMLEISINCEEGNLESHLPLMWDAVHSLQFLGNYLAV